MANIADKVYDLIKDSVENCGVNLWNVKFLKEGSSHYLRVFIDKDGGVNIDDCTNVSHAIDPIIDEADPINVSYYLEVCSPGLERELVRDEHFYAMIGRDVKLKLFKEMNGSKEICGKLISFDKELTIECENGTVTVERSQIAKTTLMDL